MKVMVALPCMDMMHTLFVRSVLGCRWYGEVNFSFTISSLIYDARNTLAEKAIEGGFDRVLWLDSDMMFDPDLFERLSARLDEGREFVTGMCFKRRPPHDPVIYKSVGLKEEDGQTIPVAIAYRDYPKDEIFPVASCGLAAVMMNTKLIKDVKDNFGLPFSPVVGFGEDLSFCQRVAQLGKTMYCDSSIKLKHIGFKEISEEDFLGGAK